MNSVVSVVVFFIIIAYSGTEGSPFIYLMEGFPMFALTSALYKMATYKMATLMGSLDLDFAPNHSIFSWEIIGMDLTYMICTGIISFIILVIIECGGMQTVKSWTMKAISRTLPPRTEEIDDDVRTEKLRIDSMSENELKSLVLVTQNVSKFYGEFLAVNQISFAVKRYDRFYLPRLFQAISTSFYIGYYLFIHSQSRMLRFAWK